MKIALQNDVKPAQYEAELARLKADGPDATVDVDYLEERARAVLRFAHPDEIVVQIDRGAQPDHGG